MKRKFIFPIFNAVVGAIFGVLIGYYIGQPTLSILVGLLLGFAVAVGIELSLPESEKWWYRRRILIVVLLESLIAVFGIGPYAYVVVGTRPDHHEICCQTPLDFSASSYEDVLIETQDGVILSGWYVPPQGQPGAVIILLHGSRSDRRGTIWHATQLIEAGYGVLLYDQRALGESTGEQVTLSWVDGYDLLAVVDYLTTRPEVDPNKIGAVGLSGGAHIILNAAYYEPNRISALWLDGLQAQRIEDFPERKNLGERFATLINALILKMAQIHLRQSPPPAFIDILSRLDQPQIMLIAGGKDDFESRENQRYATVLGPNAQLWLIEEAFHVGGHRLIPDEYRQRMLTFFETSWAE